MILDPLTSPAAGSGRSLSATGAAAGGGLMLSLSLTFVNGDAQAADADGYAPNAFIRIEGDGPIVLTMRYVEMGQGTYTSIPMLIAGELGVDLNRVRLEHAPPNERLFGKPCWAACREWAARPRYARPGSQCAKPVRSREPCSCRRRRSVGMSIRPPAVRKVAKCSTRRSGEVSSMVNLPPPPPACLSPQAWRSSAGRISRTHQQGQRNGRLWGMDVSAAGREDRDTCAIARLRRSCEERG
jgi:hypothetical protein